MELTNTKSLRASLSTRTGALTAAAIAAVLAGVLVFAALSSNRDSGGGSSPAAVVVANQLIAKGASGEAIAEGHFYRVTNVRESALVTSAVTDVSQLRGKVAAQDIYPGQQLSAADFERTGGALTARLGANERAVSVPLDKAHGMIGDVRSGDRVDVMAGFNVQNDGGRTRPVLKTLARNVVVLKAPKSADGGVGGSRSTQLTLRVTDTTAQNLAFAADNGKVWVILRPPAGAEDSQPRLVTLESVLFGIKPVNITKGNR